jgi:hypothetical protein
MTFPPRPVPASLFQRRSSSRKRDAAAFPYQPLSFDARTFLPLARTVRDCGRLFWFSMSLSARRALPREVCCKIRFQSARVSNKMFEDSPIEGTNIYLPSSAGRSRPRPWLSSHKLGWPFGLANPIGFEVAPSRRAFFFAFVSSHHSSLRRIVWGSPKRMDLPSAFAILAFVRACKGGGGEWREEAQTRLTAAGMARPRGRGGHDHGISFH